MELGIPFIEKDLQVHDVSNGDEAFTVITPYCLMPVARYYWTNRGDKTMNNVPMTRPEEMLAEHRTHFNTSMTFVELEDGRILQAGGTKFTLSEDGGITWSEPFERKDADGNPVGLRGKALVNLSGNGIGLAADIRAYDVPRSEQRYPWNRDVAHPVFWPSEDGGETWESPVRVTSPGLGTFFYRDTLTRTSSGRIILPVYISLGQGTGPGDTRPPASGKLVMNQWVSTAAHFFDPHFSAVYVCYSDDDGRTWKRNKDGELLILQDWNATYSYANEPSVAEVAPGRLLMVMRTGLGRLFQAWSYDNGETWTRPQPSPLAASTAPAKIRTIPSTGHLLIVWNQENEEEVKGGYNRTRISSAISRNGGSVWEFFQNVESIHETTRVEPGPIRPVRPAEYHFEPGLPAPEREREHVLPAPVHARYTYPSVLVTKSDRVLISYPYSYYEEHPARAELIRVGHSESGRVEKLKVLPLSWFYGGKEPADNPFLPSAYESATP